MHRKVAVIVVLSLALSGCAGAASPGSAATPLPAAAVTTPPAAASVASLAPTSAPPTASSIAGVPCTMGDLANKPDWKPLKPEGGKFAFLYPGSWEDHSGEVTFTLASLVDAATLAELGAAQDATVKASFVRDPAGLPNLSVFVFAPVSSSTAEIYARQEARFRSLSVIRQVVATNVEGCLGGEPATGLAFTFESEGNEYFQKNIYAVREGTMFGVQWLSQSSADAKLLDDILTTWGWTLPPLAP